MTSLPIALAASTALCVAFAASVRVRVPIEVPFEPQLIADHASLHEARRECDINVMTADAYVAYHAVNNVEAELAVDPMFDAAELEQRRDDVYAFRDQVLHRIWSCDGEDLVPRELLVHELHWSRGP